MNESLFCCPLCRKTLYKEEKRVVCENGHSFDRARRGYVNLLAGKGGRNHGDNKEMILARKNFLNSGLYEPLREALCTHLQEQMPKTLLDAGCGECYYTEGMAKALPECVFAGVDISKEALNSGCGRMKERMEGAVASIYSLPVTAEKFEALTLVFSPFSGEEFHRVLVPDGILYMVIPGKKHLWGLKKLLYEHPYENQLADYTLKGFEFLGEKVLDYTLTASGRTLRDLFAMTPYFYRTPESGRNRVLQCESLQTEAVFHILRYRKR